MSVFDGLTAKETVPDRRWSIRNRPLTKRVRAHRGKTKKGMLLASCPEFVITGETEDVKIYGQFWGTLRTSEQRCSELVLVCL